MKTNAEIQTFMTLCPHTIGLEQDVDLARKMMRQYGIRHLPVQSGGKLEGIVSDRDIQFAMAWSKTPGHKLEISDVYTPEPYIVNPTTPLKEALRKMVDEHIGCALVQSEGKLVGIFTATDACRVLADVFSEQ